MKAELQISQKLEIGSINQSLTQRANVFIRLFIWNQTLFSPAASYVLSYYCFL